MALDLGAAAGGFTQALLEAGAARVYAVDAGSGQLRGWLRVDPRVINLERTNLADVGPDLVPETVDLVTIDLSYLALADALPQIDTSVLASSATVVALVKPTYELHAGALGGRPRVRRPGGRAGFGRRGAVGLVRGGGGPVVDQRSPGCRRGLRAGHCAARPSRLIGVDWGTG